MDVDKHQLEARCVDDVMKVKYSLLVLQNNMLYKHVEEGPFPIYSAMPAKVLKILVFMHLQH